MVSENGMIEISFETEWGTARLRKDGYYYISTKTNNGCLLHRLIYEKHYGPIPEGFVIHHIDGVKTNNEINNLVMLSNSEHHSLHMKGESHPLWGKSRIDQAGGIRYLSEEKNKGATMEGIALNLGYTAAVPVHQYLRNRNLTWNEL